MKNVVRMPLRLPAAVISWMTADPFDPDANDLPLESICKNIERDVRNAVQFLAAAATGQWNFRPVHVAQMPVSSQLLQHSLDAGSAWAQAPHLPVPLQDAQLGAMLPQCTQVMLVDGVSRRH